MSSKRPPRTPIHPRKRRDDKTRNPPPPATEIPQETLPGEVRLQKYLASAGLGSRRACEELILEGRVAVDGRVIRELGTVVLPDQNEVRFDGEIVQPQKKIYWWLNKPPGVVSTSFDPQGRRTVLDLVPELGERIYAVGRLDEESTGLMLLTNDGEVAEKLTHPRYQVPKTYECLIAGKISLETISKLKQGVWLSDGKARVKDIERIGSQGQATKVRLILCEGHNREVRRLFAKFGHKVMKLERVAIGPLKIRKLRVGETRPATHEEIEILQSLAKRVARRRISVVKGTAPQEAQPKTALPRSAAGPKTGGPKTSFGKKPFAGGAAARPSKGAPRRGKSGPKAADVKRGKPKFGPKKSGGRRAGRKES